MTSPTPYQPQPNNNINNTSSVSAAPTTHGAGSHSRMMWTPTAPRKISQEELNDFTERQMRFVQQKKARIINLEARMYNGEGERSSSVNNKKKSRTVITQEALEKSVSRQHDQETQLRETRKKELEQKYAPPKPKSVTMDSEAVQEVAKRMHEQAMMVQERKKKMIAEKQRQIEEEARKVEKGKRMARDDIRSMGDRLCTPKKQLTYEEEQRRIFGKTVSIPEKFKAAARRIEEQEEEMKKAKLRKD